MWQQRTEWSVVSTAIYHSTLCCQRVPPLSKVVSGTLILVQQIVLANLTLASTLLDTLLHTSSDALIAE